MWVWLGRGVVVVVVSFSPDSAAGIGRRGEDVSPSAEPS